MSKETIWTIRPTEEIEKYVGHILTQTDLNRSSFIEAAIKLAGPILLADPCLAKHLKTPTGSCP